jgi:nitroimidazol reductase NimA-like FMN-containing flavoprotein (pyridoxamine 5'-phosphate oxidase superfamily)
MQKAEREIHDKIVFQEILSNGKFSTISFCKKNEPYLVTLSYGFDSEKNCLYFHSAKKGLKFEFLKENSLVCGTIIEDLGYNHDNCSHSYRSIVFWGNLVQIDNLDEKIHGFDILFNHLEQQPDKLKSKFFKDSKVYDSISILRLDIDEITGKASS